MVFSSIVFLFYFLPAILALYFLAPRKAKNLVLLAGSLVFYAWGEPVYIFLMMLSILANYLFGLALGRAGAGAGRKAAEGGEAEAGAAGRRAMARFWLICACALNLFLLCFFKYADFLIENINLLLGAQISPLKLPLPLGISFYTFQAMSYIIDLYRGKVQAQRSLIAFGAYVSLFPQLIAGPIVRFQTIAQELTDRRESFPLFSEGAVRFVSGLAKKVLLANGAGAVFDQVMQSDPPLSVLSAWIGILAFTFQIYFDFSGYSDMAIGLGKMLGFHFPENFNYPYISGSITEFWRRWHMTLSAWFKEYVYIPLGGNRKGILKQIRNIAAVWALTGIWHGASWNFLLWGLYFGLLLILEKLFLGRLLAAAPRAVCHVYTMFFVMISWVIFSVGSLAEIASFLEAMFGLGGGPAADNLGLYLLRNNWLFFAMLLVGSTPIPRRCFRRITGMAPMDAQESLAEHTGRVQSAAPGQVRTPADSAAPGQVRTPADSAASGPTVKSLPAWLGILLQNTAMILLFLLVTAYLVSSSYNPFLYFRF